MRCAIALILWISLGPMAFSASFDCNGPLNQIGRTICGNSALSKADEDLQASYRRALEVSLLREELETEQVDWRSSLLPDAADPRRLLDVYRKRISELQTEERASEPVSEAQAARACVTVPGMPKRTTCRVETFGGVKGDTSGTLRFQHLTFWDSDDAQQFPEEDIVVFRKVIGDPELVEPIAAAAGEAVIFDTVEFIESPIGNWILMTGHSGEHGYSEILYRDERAGRPALIDTGSWQEDLRRRVPDGFALAAYIKPDYRTMSAKAVFTIGGEPCCAANYITSIIQLGISVDRLVLETVRFERNTK